MKTLSQTLSKEFGISLMFYSETSMFTGIEDVKMSNVEEFAGVPP